METYLLNSAACLAILMLFYKLLLENESMHQFKRFYLLGSVLVALIIPFITLTTYVNVTPGSLQELSTSSILISETDTYSIINWNLVLWGIYGFGVLIFSIKFFKNLAEILLKIKQNPKVKKGRFLNVLLKDNIVPHTFFKYLFFSKDQFLNKQIPKEVTVHEETHARQLHSLDILLMEILQILFWFNPLIYLTKNAIKLNHEFLADQSVIDKGIDTSIYQRTLLAFSSNAEASNLANAFNYSSIKKRFTVMKTHTTKTTIWSRGLLILPLFTLLLYSFSTRENVEMENFDAQKYSLEKAELIGDEKNNFDSIAISEVISISILKDENLIISNKPTNLRSLSSDLVDFTKRRFSVSGKQISKVYIETSSDTPINLIEDVKEIIIKSGISEIYISTEGKNEYSKVKMNSFKESREIDQKIATDEMVKEYNKLAKKYNSLPKSERTISREELSRMVYIYDRMEKNQRSKSEEFPQIILPKNPPPPPRPTSDLDLNGMVTPPPTVKKPVIISVVESATPPPPPAPPTFEKLVADGAIFYYNGKIIEPEKARILVEVKKSVNVQISYTDDEKPIVTIMDKKNND